MDAHRDVWGPRGAKSIKAGHFVRPVINPMTMGCFGVPFGYHFGSSWLHLGSLWATFGVSFRSLLGGSVCSPKKEVPGPPRTSNPHSFWEPFWLHFSSFFMTFLETSKTGFGTTLQYFRRFLLSKGSHLGVQFRFRFRSVFGPLKKAHPGRSPSHPGSTPGQLFGPAGGGFRRGVC